MRGFEQAISNTRYHLMQFHRPAMLKLVTGIGLPTGRIVNVLHNTLPASGVVDFYFYSKGGIPHGRS